jgi:hypothetical protein
MDKRHVAIATITLARDGAEHAVLLRGLEALAAFGRTVFVTDGGSDPDFVVRAREIEGVTLVEPACRGVWPQARSSLRAALASGAERIFYTEPDKRDFFSDDLAGFICEAPHDAGVVLVSRSAQTLVTFPAFQQYTEGVINRCCAEVIEASFDYSYGPFLLARDVVAHLAGAPDDVGWGWRPYAFVIAHRLGLGVQSLVRASACPSEQRSEAEKVYRMQQLAESVRGLVLGAKAPL